jgi:hypothetical protein
MGQVAEAGKVCTGARREPGETVDAVVLVVVVAFRQAVTWRGGPISGLKQGSSAASTRQTANDIKITKPVRQKVSLFILRPGLMMNTASNKQIPSEFQVSLPRNGNFKRAGRDYLERQEHDCSRQVAVGNFFVRLIQGMA